MSPDLQYAPMATTDIHHTPVHLTATTALTGLSVECSWAPGRGMEDITAAEALVLDITVEATTTQPTLDAVMQAVQVAATMAAPVVDFTVQHVVTAVAGGITADAADRPAHVRAAGSCGRKKSGHAFMAAVAVAARSSPFSYLGRRKSTPRSSLALVVAGTSRLAIGILRARSSVKTQSVFPTTA